MSGASIRFSGAAKRVKRELPPLHRIDRIVADTPTASGAHRSGAPHAVKISLLPLR
jgi:hypothetical protein